MAFSEISNRALRRPCPSIGNYNLHQDSGRKTMVDSPDRIITLYNIVNRYNIVNWNKMVSAAYMLRVSKKIFIKSWDYTFCIFFCPWQVGKVLFFWGLIAATCNENNPFSPSPLCGNENVQSNFLLYFIGVKYSLYFFWWDCIL